MHRQGLDSPAKAVLKAGDWFMPKIERHPGDR